MALPIKRAESVVKIKACKNATIIFNERINKVKETDNTMTGIFLNLKIKEIKLSIIIWPAVIFANKRIHNVKGLRKIPTNSIGANKIRTGKGMSGIHNIWCQ